MKYRRLTAEELQELEKEFIHFLSVNSITGPDWEKMKKEDLEKAEGFIETFSDMVMERALGKLKYLELRNPKDWKIFFIQESQVELICIQLPEEATTDLTQSFSSEDLTEQGAKIYSAQKTYKEQKELEVFEMVNSGCTIADEKSYDMMKKLLSWSKS